jgi:hypothetical protein
MPNEPAIARFSRVFSCICWAWPRVWSRPRAWCNLRRKMGDAVRLIEETSLHLAGAGAQWAKHRKCPSDAEGRFSADVCGAKAHVVYDRDLGCPIYHMITEATVNVAAKTMPVEAGATSVFAHFIGRSENAVRIQIAVALIALLLLSRLAQDGARPTNPA